MNTNDTLNHLKALRTRVFHAVIGYFVLAIVLAVFAKPLFHTFAKPLMDLLPSGQLIATQVAAPFMIPLKFSLLLSLGLALPWLLYQVWLFVSPGLYAHEKKHILSTLFGCLLLFYGGVAFAYFVVLPMVFKFFVTQAPMGVAVLTDISAYVDFILKLFFAFGVAFQMPIAVIMLTRMGIVKVETLKKQRPYVIILAFTLGMLLTPPDVISQTLLAIPLWLLFELGLWLSDRTHFQK